MPATEKTPKKAKKTSTRKSAARKPAAAKATSSSAKAGDLIVIESEKVGSPAREGEVLEVVQGQVSVSYLVRWTDGRQSLIAPGAGNTRIVPSQTRG
jgi:hypothetical protein